MVDPSGLVYVPAKLPSEWQGAYQAYLDRTKQSVLDSLINPHETPAPDAFKPAPAQKYNVEEGLAIYRKQQEQIILRIGIELLLKYGHILIPRSIAKEAGKHEITTVEDLIEVLPYITDIKSGEKGFTFRFNNNTRTSYTWDLSQAFYEDEPRWTHFSFGAGGSHGYEDDPHIYALMAFVGGLQGVGQAAFSRLGSATQIIPGTFTSKDMALGVHEYLQAFKGEALIGTDLPGTTGLMNEIKAAMQSTVSKGGALRFNLTGMDVKAALDPASKLYGTYTSQELRYVLNKINLFKNTSFYLNNELLSTTKVLELIK